jgi:hypothetical protein
MIMHEFCPMKIILKILTIEKYSKADNGSLKLWSKEWLKWLKYGRQAVRTFFCLVNDGNG